MAHRIACHARPAQFPSLVCLLDVGHEGPHTAWHNWTTADEDDAPTAKLPPITETVRRRPPPPPVPVRVTELTGEQLVEALMAELERERNGGEEL